MKYSIILAVFVFSSFALFAQPWQPGEVFIDIRNNKEYRTAKIGNQVWMTDNLNIGELIVSDKPGALMTNNGKIERYCWNNGIDGCDGTNGEMKRGGFYEWQEAMQYYNGQPALPVQGICPDGWHIPSNGEWNELLNYLVSTYNLTSYTLLAQAMLVGGKSGFDALLTGYRCTMNGMFRISATAPDTRTYYYTSEQTDNSNAPAIEIGGSSFTTFSIPKSIGLCIRCIWDGNISSTIERNDNEISDIKIFPSPATDFIIVRNLLPYCTDNKIRIYSPEGILMMKIEYNDRIDISRLPNGMYFIKAGFKILKFVKIA